MWSDSVETTDRLCSTISTVRLAATFLISAAMRSTSSCVMPAVGSSSSIISGSSASVVAISSARLRPYGSSTAVRVRELGQARPRRSARARASSSSRKRALRAPEIERVAALALQRDAHVLEHGQMRKHRGDLERAHESHARDRRRPRAGDLAAVEEDLAARRRQEMRQQVEAGRLAGAVGPDQRVDRAAADSQVDVR